MFAQCVKDFRACTKKFDIRYEEGPFTKRSANGLCVGKMLKVVFSSLKNVPERCCSHSASKIFAHAKKLDFRHRLRNANGLCVGRTLTARY